MKKDQDFRPNLYLMFIVAVVYLQVSLFCYYVNNPHKDFDLIRDFWSAVTFQREQN